METISLDPPFVGYAVRFCHYGFTFDYRGWESCDGLLVPVYTEKQDERYIDDLASELNNMSSKDDYYGMEIVSTGAVRSKNDTEEVVRLPDADRRRLDLGKCFGGCTSASQCSGACSFCYLQCGGSKEPGCCTPPPTCGSGCNTNADCPSSCPNCDYPLRLMCRS